MLSHDVPTAAARAALDDPPVPVRPARATYRRLRIGGWTEGEAGNLTAHLTGLAVARSGWKVEEIERLLFVRELARTGRLRS